MEYTKIQYFEKIEKPTHQDFISAHNNCILCGTVLELQHIRLDDINSMKEEAHCPECDLKTRAKIYILM